MEMIDKSAVVAEIEDKIRKYTRRGEESDANHDGYGMYWGGVISCLNEIRSFLDTLKTKDMDIDKACKWLEENAESYLLYPFCECDKEALTEDFKKYMED